MHVQGKLYQADIPKKERNKKINTFIDQKKTQKMENMLIKKQLRSISLPSSSHPSTSGVEEALAKVKTIDTTKSSFELISTGLAGLEELYDCTVSF